VRLRAATVALALCLLAPAAGAAGFGPVPHNPADRLARLPIDPYRYDYATRCVKRPQAGMLALERWLDGHVRGESWGIVRCERLGSGHYSLHSEGRAIDWRLNVHKPVERRAASRLIRLLLATDKAGNRHALARRMGVQEIIWNCRAWWAGDHGLVKYSPCYDADGHRQRIDETNAHRNHVHIGMNRPGARKRTTFWTRGR
jgi:hypothetical protein